MACGSGCPSLGLEGGVLEGTLPGLCTWPRQPSSCPPLTPHSPPQHSTPTPEWAAPKRSQSSLPSQPRARLGDFGQGP